MVAAMRSVTPPPPAQLMYPPMLIYPPELMYTPLVGPVKDETLIYPQKKLAERWLDPHPSNVHPQSV